MFFRNYWQRNYKNKKRIRLKRKERMTAEEWMNDWYRALHSLGWTCRQGKIGPDRVRLTESELFNLGMLRVQKGTTAIYLHPSVETLQGRLVGTELWEGPAPKTTKTIRIVRGRRPDARRGIGRVADGTATKIVPNEMLLEPFLVDRDGHFGLAPFLVDFDEGLFQRGAAGDWSPVEDDEANEIYASYLEASPHRNSFRSYTNKPKLMVPHDTELGRGSNSEHLNFIPFKTLK